MAAVTFLFVHCVSVLGGVALQLIVLRALTQTEYSLFVAATMINTTALTALQNCIPRALHRSVSIRSEILFRKTRLLWVHLSMCLAAGVISSVLMVRTDATHVGGSAAQLFSLDMVIRAAFYDPALLLLNAIAARSGQACIQILCAAIRPTSVFLALAICPSVEAVAWGHVGATLVCLIAVLITLINRSWSTAANSHSGYILTAGVTHCLTTTLCALIESAFLPLMYLELLGSLGVETLSGGLAVFALGRALSPIGYVVAGTVLRDLYIAEASGNANLIGRLARQSLSIVLSASAGAFCALSVTAPPVIELIGGSAYRCEALVTSVVLFAAAATAIAAFLGELASAIGYHAYRCIAGSLSLVLLVVTAPQFNGQSSVAALCLMALAQLPAICVLLMLVRVRVPMWCPVRAMAISISTCMCGVVLQWFSEWGGWISAISSVAAIALGSLCLVSAFVEYMDRRSSHA